jgi:hypothetical protein
VAGAGEHDGPGHTHAAGADNGNGFKTHVTMPSPASETNFGTV